MDDAALARSGGPVTVGLVDGRVRSGRITKFSPRLTTLELRPEGSGAGAFGGSSLLPVEKVAWVGFPSLPPGHARPAGLASVKLHLAGRRTFAVEAPAAGGAPLTVGFFAYPSDPSEPFAEVFFYGHAVVRREHPEKLGSMLVADGVVTDAALQRGVQAQSPKLGDILVEQGKVAPVEVEAAASLQARRRLRLGEILVEAGLATTEDVEAALVEQRARKGRKIGEVLVAMGVVTEPQVAAALARKFHMPYQEFAAVKVDAAAQREVPRELVERYGFLPVATDPLSLTIAISDPLNTEIDDVLRFQFPSRRLKVIVVPPSQLKEAVARALERPSFADDERQGVDSIVDALAAEPIAEDAGEEEGTDGAENDSAIVKLANQIISDAFKQNASDIHVETNGAEAPTVVRFRIDGDCVLYKELPPSVRGPIVARFKIMSKLDISERRKPQDGKIRFKLPDRRIELRVATLPTVNSNEDVVMRILAASKPQPLDGMGFTPDNLAALKEALKKPYGLVLCVGPTGSGKTTTLHSMLGQLNTPDMKIWTAEDPVEITQPGLRQVQMQSKVGLTFATAMRAFLRADPDVIMVGEMRDEETASIGVEASLTGHLVLSTLHTNSAPETITRLLDMGLDPFSFADALVAILAQRLARRLCGECKERGPATREAFDALASAYGPEALARKGIAFGPDLSMYTAVGCERCGGTGYKGRIPLHELLVANDEIRGQIQKHATIAEIRAAAIRSGMTTLVQDGIHKALEGGTDLLQVLAVASK